MRVAPRGARVSEDQLRRSSDVRVALSVSHKQGGVWPWRSGSGLARYKSVAVLHRMGCSGGLCRALLRQMRALGAPRATMRSACLPLCRPMVRPTAHIARSSSKHDGTPRNSWISAAMFCSLWQSGLVCHVMHLALPLLAQSCRAEQSDQSLTRINKLLGVGRRADASLVLQSPRREGELLLMRAPNATARVMSVGSQTLKDNSRPTPWRCADCSVSRPAVCWRQRRAAPLCGPRTWPSAQGKQGNKLVFPCYFRGVVSSSDRGPAERASGS